MSTCKEIWKSKLWRIELWNEYIGFNWQPYDYSGSDRRLVLDCILYLGFIKIIKYYRANQYRSFY